MRRNAWVVFGVVGVILLAIILFVVYEEHQRQESIRRGGETLQGIRR